MTTFATIQLNPELAIDHKETELMDTDHSIPGMDYIWYDCSSDSIE